MGNECKKVERMNKRQRASVQVARGGGRWSVLRGKGRRASRVVETDRWFITRQVVDSMFGRHAPKN